MGGEMKGEGKRKRKVIALGKGGKRKVVGDQGKGIISKKALLYVKVSLQSKKGSAVPILYEPLLTICKLATKFISCYIFTFHITLNSI